MAQQTRGFTLVEMLVTVVVLALLLALIVGPLAGVRARARGVKSLSNVRQLTTILATYSDEQRGYLPSVRAGGRYRAGCDGLTIYPTHWQAATIWPALVDENLSTTHPEYLFSPGPNTNQTSCPFETDYAYSTSFIARPEVWMPGTIPAASLLNGTRLDEVSHPSRKALLWDNEARWFSVPKFLGLDLAVPTAVGSVDGAASSRRPSDCAAPAPRVLTGTDHEGARLHNTPSGVRGVDF